MKCELQTKWQQVFMAVLRCHHTRTANTSKPVTNMQHGSWSTKREKAARSDVLTAVLSKILVPWDVMLYQLGVHL